MSKVIFQIEGGSPVAIECNPSDNLLEAARRVNVAIDAPCSGNGSCGKCRVKLMEGTLDSLQSRHISQWEWDEGWRLSCCSKVSGECTVLVPDIASAYKSRMKTADLSSPNPVRMHYCRRHSRDCSAERPRISGLFPHNPRCGSRKHLDLQYPSGCGWQTTWGNRHLPSIGGIAGTVVCRCCPAPARLCKDGPFPLGWCCALLPRSGAWTHSHPPLE